MKTALVLGGGDCLESDVRDARAMGVVFDGVVACNDAGFWWPHELDAWVSLHPNKFGAWRSQRNDKGYPPCKQFFGHRAENDYVTATNYQFPRQSNSASSGCFAAKVALMDLEYDRAVLCGVPLVKRPHFFDNHAWRSAEDFRRGFLQVPQQYLDRMRSMSGWTRVLLGSPRDWVANGGSQPHVRGHNPAFAAQAASRR